MLLFNGLNLKNGLYLSENKTYNRRRLSGRISDGIDMFQIVEGPVFLAKVQDKRCSPQAAAPRLPSARLPSVGKC